MSLNVDEQGVERGCCCVEVVIESFVGGESTEGGVGVVELVGQLVQIGGDSLEVVDQGVDRKIAQLSRKIA